MEATIRKVFGIIITCLILLLGTFYLALNKIDFTIKPIHSLLEKSHHSKNVIPVVQSNLRNAINRTQFRILYWTGSSRGPRSPRNWFGLGTAPFQKCEYKNCVLTDNRAEYNDTDAVLMYMRYAKPMPTYRFPWQKWVMRIHESPANEKSYTEYNHVFNATWTYHTKSDIYSHIYYKQFTRRKDSTAKLPEIGFGHRNLSVAWFVSRCDVQSERGRLVKSLQKYLQVDIYGECGTLKCGQRLNKDCDRMLSTRYKFYLSFENSLCQEYVTEKLWRAYSNNIVPIVMGASNYSAYLPEHSYIDIGKFGSVKELAEYVKLVDGNETLYTEYFNWRKHLEITHFEGDACPLCEFMNVNANVTKIYDRLDLFWNTARDCTPPGVYYKNLFNSL